MDSDDHNSILIHLGMPSTNLARELPLVQRGIVDNCFEEGHYEYGIGVLDRLRGQKYKPAPLHMRQLLYISLYPPPPQRPQRAEVPLSPQKAQLQRQKDDLWPKPASRRLAIALLEAFTSTNNPESLMRGLPFYSYKNNEGILDVDPFQGEEMQEEHIEDNSPIRKEVLAIQEAKNCWELLKNGFVKRKQMDRSRMENIDESALGAARDKIIGPYAWPVLEWFINVFERDERQAEARGQDCCSALLLCQIPPPGSKKGPRWDAEVPLKIVCACLSPIPCVVDQPYKYVFSEKRFRLGTRLFTQLVNLTMTRPPLLSSTDFVRSMVSHIRSLALQSVEQLLSAIPHSQAFFKVSLLESYISEAIGSRSSGLLQTSAGLVPRAKPKFAGKGASKSCLASISLQDKDKHPYPMPPRDSLLMLLSSHLPSLGSSDSGELQLHTDSVVKVALAKFYLLSTLYTLFLSRRLMDVTWITAVQTGDLRRSVEAGFTFMDQDNIGDERYLVQKYMSGALEMTHIWERSSLSV